jgi:hypothetical protein
MVCYISSCIFLSSNTQSDQVKVSYIIREASQEISHKGLME